MSSTSPAGSTRLLASFAAITAVAFGAGAWIGTSVDGGSAPTSMASPTDMASSTSEGAFGDQVRAYLMENPQVLVEAINVLEQRQQDAEAQNARVLVETNKDAIFNASADWVSGNPQGDITVVEFLDYRCTYCRKAFEEVNQLIEKDGNIRFVVKEFPILGQESDLAGRFAVAVKQLSGDETYEQVHNALMGLRGTVTLETLGKIATDFGADKDAVFKRMNEEEVTAVLRANRQLAERLQIAGTPAFVIGGDMLKGYAPLETLQSIVAAERG